MFLKVFVALLMMAAVDHTVKPVDTTKSLKLAATYKRNKLQEISGDGSLLLFYESSKPVRTYTIPLGGGKGSAINRTSTRTRCASSSELVDEKWPG